MFQKKWVLAWKDALAAEMAAHPEEPREKLEQYCDFTAIRLLHARQAEKLGEREWKNENGGSSFFSSKIQIFAPDMEPSLGKSPQVTTGALMTLRPGYERKSMRPGTGPANGE
jgi:hypothetical protein